MNITAIETFLAVVRTGHLNRAAEQLNITQSAVTARLDALEQAIGAKLLVRSRKGSSLTKPGYAFLEQAEMIVRSWETARASTSLPRGVTRIFSLVCHPTLWTGLGERWLGDLRRDHPGTAFEVWAGLPDDARRWLQSGMSDAALLPEPLSEPGIETRAFQTDRILQVDTRPRAAVTWDPDYVYVDYGPAIRIQHAAAWSAENTASASYSNPDWALAHILSEGGSAYLPQNLVADLVEKGQLFPVEGAPEFTRRSFLSWRESSSTAFSWLAESDAG